MGCLNSKHLASVALASSPIDHERGNSAYGYGYYSSKRGGEEEDDSLENSGDTQYQIPSQRSSNLHSRKSKKGSVNGRNGFDEKQSLSSRIVETENVVGGWPPWLSAAAAEAVDGWVPLQASKYEKLEKIGQGTYSSVFRARDLETGKMVALKKVHFQNFQPDSIRFMAREIMILRRLDHPNIMKLEGIITSRTSKSIYLVFEYMEHDLAGLSSCPDVRFSEAQVKCLMKQLLWALEHCHLRGIAHRDIKASNILINNEGVLKLGDFGLANIITPRNKNQLTSRVVTLWYRSPELLMGSTSYGVSVDMWSVGCVFAEIFLKKPILKGRTEIEQLHKIFKLCGAPSEDYWNKCTIPHVSMFKPQTSYESTLRETCEDFPRTAMNLIETLLSIEPEKRGTASSALMSEYFSTRPYACEPSHFPKYPPNKEMDAKHREELQRKKGNSKIRDSGATKKSRARRIVQETRTLSNLAPKEKQEDYASTYKNRVGNAQIHRGRENMTRRKPSLDTVSETSEVTTSSQGNYSYSGLSQATAPTGGHHHHPWIGKRRKDDASSTLTYHQPISRSQLSSDSSIIFQNNTFGLTQKRE